MTFSPGDAKRVSALITRKLELYMNYERRETRFELQGRLQTRPQMLTFDLMYQMLDKAQLDRRSQRSKQAGEKHRNFNKSPHKTGMDVKTLTAEDQQSTNNQDQGNCVSKTKHDGGPDDSYKNSLTIQPNLLNNSRQVVSRKEAARITKLVNKVFAEQDLDRLYVIHRYRPHTNDVAAITENGKVANYTMHVGSALNSKNYVEFYMREGLQTGNKDNAARLKKLNTKKEKSYISGVVLTESSKIHAVKIGEYIHHSALGKEWRSNTNTELLQILKN